VGARDAPPRHWGRHRASPTREATEHQAVGRQIHAGLKEGMASRRSPPAMPEAIEGDWKKKIVPTM
jgi:hypothetical protein